VKPHQRVTIAPPDTMVIAPYADLLEAAAKRVTQDRSLEYAVEIIQGFWTENDQLRHALKLAKMSASQWEDIAELRGAALVECEASKRGLKVWAGIGKGVVISVGVGLAAIAVHQYTQR